MSTCPGQNCFMLGICFSEELVLISSFAFFLYFFLHFFLGYLLKGKKKKNNKEPNKQKTPIKTKTPNHHPPKNLNPETSKKTPNQQQTPKNPKPSYPKHQPVKFCTNIKQRVAPYAEVLQSVDMKATTTGMCPRGSLKSQENVGQARAI